jgi:NDP-sugar pyrophosphorylase family protein
VQCLILAGGLGTRVQGVDPSLPKTLLPVAGRPFADWQLRWLAGQGVDSVVYSVGHRADQVRAFVGDGSAWGIAVEYVEETDGLLGTGGAVRLAVDQGVLGQRFFVLYGDSYLRVDLAAVDDAFTRRGLPAMMTVFANDGRWDASNVVFDGRLVVEYRKGLPDPPPAMRFIDYGLLELRRDLVVDEVPSGRPSDLAALLEPLSRRSRLAGVEVAERFFEIGSPEGIAELDRFLTDGGNPARGG